MLGTQDFKVRNLRAPCNFLRPQPCTGWFSLNFIWDTILDIVVFLGAVFLLQFLDFNTICTPRITETISGAGRVFLLQLLLGFLYMLCRHYLSIIERQKRIMPE